jgi:hypothetical protein
MEKTIERICSMLQGVDGMRRCAAAMVLTELGPKDPAVVKALKDSNQLLTRYVLEAFEAIGTRAVVQSVSNETARSASPVRKLTLASNSSNFSGNGGANGSLFSGRSDRAGSVCIGITLQAGSAIGFDSDGRVSSYSAHSVAYFSTICASRLCVLYGKYNVFSATNTPVIMRSINWLPTKHPPASGRH